MEFKISNSAQSEISRIAGYLPEQECSYKSMKDCMKSRMSVIRVEKMIGFLKSLSEHRAGTVVLDKIVRYIVYGGRETYEYHKERKYDINGEREVVELLGKRIDREERELRKKHYAEKAARKTLQDTFRRQEGGQEHFIWNLNYNFERANDRESDRLKEVLEGII